jgi:hypothetical protein
MFLLYTYFYSRKFFTLYEMYDFIMPVAEGSQNAVKVRY